MSRDINDLTPKLREACSEFLRKCVLAGHDVFIVFTLRTAKEQIALYAQGREPIEAVNAKRAKAGMPPLDAASNAKPVTWTLNSKHLPGEDNLARAFDFAVRVDGKLTWNTRFYKGPAQIAKDMGLEAGYFWRKADPGHVQLDKI